VIAFVTFDTATVAVWRDVSLLKNHPDRDLLLQTLDTAFHGSGDDVQKIVQSTLPPTRLTCLDIAGAVWHEKRHYVDVMLTNYGAFKRRMFFQLFPLISPCVEEAKKAGEIVLPLDVYASPIARRFLGIKSSGPALDEAARMIARRKKFLTEENFIFPELGRAVGGDAILEALGAMCEDLNLHTIFGTQEFEQWLVARNYGWRSNPRYDLSRIMPPELMPLLPGGKAVNIQLVTAIMYAALMGRVWGRTDDPTVRMSTGRPSIRLATLVQEFQSHRDLKLDTHDAWSLVNDACERIWGLSAIEELERDCESEEEFVRWLGNESPTGALANDIFQVRLQLVDLFKKAPSLFLLMGKSANFLLARIAPPLIEYDATGPAEPRRPRHMYRGSSDLCPGGFTWARACEDYSDDFMAVNTHLVPLARLMLNGQREEMRAGGELMLAESTMRHGGINVRYAASHAVPGAADETAALFRLAPPCGLSCRFCSRPVQASDSRLLSTYQVRANQTAAQRAMALLGGTYAGYVELFRDWSSWLACTECLAEFGDCAAVALQPTLANATAGYRDNEFQVSFTFAPSGQAENPPAPARPKPSEPGKPKIGRNELCTCGSGLKFKKCCGKAL
jgi:SEC-C motif